MTTFTPNFALPYPDALDAPCDFAEDWCAFTSAVNAVATRFEATVNRTVPTIPMARMELVTPVTLLDGSLIPFNSVSVNTAGWVDFDASATDIVTDRAGYFVCVADANISSTGVLGQQIAISINSGVPGGDGQTDRAVTAMGFCCAHIIANLTTPLAHNVRVTRNSVGSLTVLSASFSVWWHADTATP